MSAAVYIRVSSPKGQKTDSQRAELEAWLKRHRHKAVQWFEDRDSATNLQREAFQKLQAAIFAGKVTTVVVWKLDRLARSLKEGVNVLADWCNRGVRASPKSNWHTSRNVRLSASPLRASAARTAEGNQAQPKLRPLAPAP